MSRQTPWIAAVSIGLPVLGRGFPGQGRPNLWGLSTSEWRGAGQKPFRAMSAGLAILVVAMFLVGSEIK
jgi:hypothetical protein